MTRKAAALLLIPAFLLGCEESPTDTTDRAPSGTIGGDTTTDRPTTPPPPPTGDLQNQAKQSAVTQAETQIQSVQTQLTQFRQQASTLEGDAQQRIMDAIDSAETQLRDCQSKLTQLRDAGDNWSNTSRELNDCVSQTREQVDQVRQQLQQANQPPTPPMPPGSGEPPAPEPPTPEPPTQDPA